MKCPKCGLINPEDAQRCDCGYDFESGRVERPYYHDPRLDEVDPLLCPFCGAEMRVLAFIFDFGAAKAIRKSLEQLAQEPEPLAHAPPATFELVAESA